MPELKVRDLMDFEIGQWKEQLIRDLFLEYKAEEITRIPLSPWWPQDVIVWHSTNDRNFTMKYQLSIDLKRQERI